MKLDTDVIRNIVREAEIDGSYEKFGKDVFDISISKEGYSSIHYLLWYDGKYVEIQVRTIYDEAWSECTHDLVYKCKNKAQREGLSELSECLAIRTQAAARISDLMYSKSREALNEKENTKENQVLQEEKVFDEKRFEKLHERIRSMGEVGNRGIEFDGAVDHLFD